MSRNDILAANNIDTIINKEAKTRTFKRGLKELTVYIHAVPTTDEMKSVFGVMIHMDKWGK